MQFITSQFTGGSFFILSFIAILQLLITMIYRDLNKLILFLILDNILFLFFSVNISNTVIQKEFLIFSIGINTIIMLLSLEGIFFAFTVRRVQIVKDDFFKSLKHLFFECFGPALLILLATSNFFFIKRKFVNYGDIAVVSKIMTNVGILCATLLFTGMIYSSAKYNERIIDFIKLMAGKKLTGKIKDYSKSVSDSKIRLKDFILKSNKDEVKKFIEEYVEKIDDDEIEYIELFSDIDCDNGDFPLKNIDYLMSIYDFIFSASKEDFSDKESDYYELGTPHSGLFWGGVGYFMNICRYPNTEGSHDFVGRNSLSLGFFINCVVKKDLAEKDISEIVGLGVLQTAFFQELNKA